MKQVAKPCAANLTEPGQRQQAFYAPLVSPACRLAKGHNFVMRTILYVEDTDSDADLAISAFRRANIARQIVIVTSGEDALEWLETNTPVLILVDLGLPTMSGVKLIHTIRNTLATAHIPIVIVTGREDDEQVLSALGADAYLVKPLDVQQLIDKLRPLGRESALIE